MLALQNFIRGAGNSISSFRTQKFEISIGLGGGFLDLCQCHNETGRQTKATNIKIVERSLSLSAIHGVLWNRYVTHTIGFDSFAHCFHLKILSPLSVFVTVAGHYFSKNVLEDAAMLVILNFFRRIESSQCAKFNVLAILCPCNNRHFERT